MLSIVCNFFYWYLRLFVSCSTKVWFCWHSW